MWESQIIRDPNIHFIDIRPYRGILVMMILNVGTLAARRSSKAACLYRLFDYRTRLETL